MTARPTVAVVIDEVGDVIDIMQSGGVQVFSVCLNLPVDGDRVYKMMPRKDGERLVRLIETGRYEPFNELDKHIRKFREKQFFGRLRLVTGEMMSPDKGKL